MKASRRLGTYGFYMLLPTLSSFSFNVSGHFFFVFHFLGFECLTVFKTIKAFFSMGFSCFFSSFE